MGRMMASGEAVPISSLEGVTPNQAEILEQKGVTNVEQLAAASVDDLVDALDVSLDEAEKILASAGAIVAAKEEEERGPEENTGSGGDETVEQGETVASNAGEAPEEIEAADDAAMAFEEADANAEGSNISAEGAEESAKAQTENFEANDEADSQEPETPAETDR
jgi:hypothetical protein